MTAELRVFALQGIPEIEAGDDLGALLAEAAGRAGGLVDGDVLVVAQKVVSKAEGRIVRLDDIEPTERARELSGSERDPRHVQAILDESAARSTVTNLIRWPWITASSSTVSPTTGCSISPSDFGSVSDASWDIK